MSQFVSRAGAKLEHAINTFNINVEGFTCADFGCSTGGFTQCLLQKGAAKVYSIDTGYGVLDYTLRINPKVVVMERINAMHVKLPEPMDFICIDVNWTRQKNIIPNALNNLKEGSYIVSLLKPHYEAERRMLRGGKLQEEFIQEVVNKVRSDLQTLNVNVLDIIESPIEGQKGGNKEFLILIKK